MGTEKALLDAGGVTFVTRVVEALKVGGCDPVLVVVPDAGTRTAEEAHEAGALVLVNLEPGEGPITSLRIALLMLDGAADAVAFCPVDHPLIRARTVRTLLDAFAREAPPLLLPVHRGRHGHPTLFARSLYAELADPHLSGGARTVVHRHLDDALLVPVEDEGVVTDIDTPEEYLYAMGGGFT
jgi:CTP:molybdopterin cytidylyltransferase MocA